MKNELLIRSEKYASFASLFPVLIDMAEKNIEWSANPDFPYPLMGCMPGLQVEKLWQWDSCFMSLYSDFSSGRVNGFNNLDFLYRCQREDGYICMTYSVKDMQPVFDGRINPPLFAYVEYEHYRRTGDSSRFAHVYPHLTRYYAWIETNRRRPNGLYFFEDSGSSGMDNSPRSGYAAEALRGSDVCFIDLISQQQLSAQYLSAMARVLGLKEDEAFYAGEADRIAALIHEKHWNGKTGFYYDVFHGTCNCLANKTIAAFWPMLCGITSPEQTDALLQHLLNPAEFNTPHPFASLSADDPNYDPLGNYWCGSVWCPTNYMVIKGLRRIGRVDLAKKYALRHLQMVCDIYHSADYPDIWECYSPEKKRPANRKDEPCVRSNFAGWSGLPGTALFIEEILGIQLDAPSRKVVWYLDTDDRCRIGAFSFNGVLLTLDYDDNRVRVDYAGELDLEVITDSGRYSKRITPSDNVLSIL